MNEIDSILASAASGKRVVLGHDWLTGMRGGERCLEHFCSAFPSAPLVTLLSNPQSVSEVIRSRDIRTSFMQRIPGVAKYYRKMLPIMGLAATSTKVPDCDLFLTTSSCVAHAFRPPVGAKMVCYCFSPMRYAWLFSREYLGSFKSFIAAPYLAYLRRWDRAHSVRPDLYIAISRHVQNRIEKFYGRKSDVVYPPVDTERLTPSADGGLSNGGYDLIVSALVPYKRIDLAVKAYGKNGYPLKIVGAGSSRARIERSAPSNVEFLGWKTDDEILSLYRNCRFLIFPGEEDYGIVPLEAMACGKPVIAFGRGGVTETVVNGQTGLFFEEQNADSLSSAVLQASRMNWNHPAIRARALCFDVKQFMEGMARSIGKVLQN